MSSGSGGSRTPLYSKMDMTGVGDIGSCDSEKTQPLAASATARAAMKAESLALFLGSNHAEMIPPSNRMIPSWKCGWATRSFEIIVTIVSPHSKVSPDDGNDKQDMEAGQLHLMDAPNRFFLI